MKKVGIFFCFLLQSSAWAQTCQPSVDSCGFYTCEESIHHCGPGGYPIGFGFKFCQKFLLSNASFSEPAQHFLHDVRLCLMQDLSQLDHGLTCDELKTAALDSHVECYVQSGYCELNGIDQLRIMWTMRESAIYPEVRKNAFVLEKACNSRNSL